MTRCVYVCMFVVKFTCRPLINMHPGNLQFGQVKAFILIVLCGKWKETKRELSGTSFLTESSVSPVYRIVPKTPRAPLRLLAGVNKWPIINAVQKFGQPFGFRNPDSVIDCSGNWLPGTIFCKSIPKKKKKKS